MDQRLDIVPTALGRLRSAAREMAERGAAFRVDLSAALLELADLARRSGRRRRHGDGHV